MIDVRNVSKKYFGGRQVLYNISLNISRDEKIFVFGIKRSGKTTLLKTISGLEGYESGTIEIDNKRLEDINISNLDISYAFEDLALPHLKNVEKVMLRPLRLRRIPLNQAKERVIDMLKKHDILHLKDMPCLFLNDLDRVRVAIARAFIREANVIIFDNPLSTLDTNTRREFFPILYEYISDYQGTIIYATDNIDEISSGDNRIAHISNGRLLQYDRLFRLLSRPHNLTTAKEIGGYNTITVPRYQDRYQLGNHIINVDTNQNDIVIALSPDNIVLDDNGDIDAKVKYIDANGYAYVRTVVSDRLLKCRNGKKADRISIDFKGSLIYDAIDERLIN